MIEATNFGRTSLITRYKRYADEAYRDGVIGQGRWKQYHRMIRRLEEFLACSGRACIKASEFDVNLLLEYRHFVINNGNSHRSDKKMGNNSVVHEMKALKAFFCELENSEEVMRSPFRRLSTEKRKTIMRVMYDEPFFLRSDEFLAVLRASLPEHLAKIRDIFILNCCLGCRIGDLSCMSMENVGVSPEGIPFIHYFPSKTKNTSVTNREVTTPLVRCAYDIIMATRFSFNSIKGRSLMQNLNKDLPEVLRVCGIDRKVSVWNESLQRNIYKPLWQLATTRLARKTHIDMMNKVQINLYAAGLHRGGSAAVLRYTSFELKDRFTLMNAAFGQPAFIV